MAIEKVWYQDHFPVGMTITGDTLKDLAEKKLFDVAFAMVNDAMIQADDLDFATVDDKEVWVIALNTNSHTIRFMQVFTENRVFIETTTKVEEKKLPPFDFAHAL